MSDFNYEVKEEIAVLSEGKSSTKKLCLVSYNGKAAVFDIRNWSKEGEMYKGITLTMAEAEIAVDALSKWLERFK